jgi:uncharacterized protein YjbJ (UPF0337 family)
MARGLRRHRGFIQAIEEDLMNKDVMQGKWREMKGKVKEQWGKLTDDDLDKIEGTSDQLLGLLQQRYGYAREKAEEEYKRFIDRYSREFETDRAARR